jgi:hypothetical protein
MSDIVASALYPLYILYSCIELCNAPWISCIQSKRSRQIEKKQKQLRCINLTIKHCTDERQIIVCSGGNVLDLKIHYRPKTKKWQEKKTKRMWEEGPGLWNKSSQFVREF